jgi:hypothetical protein
VVDPRVCVPRVKTVSPRPANALQANGKERHGGHTDVLKAVRVGQLTLKQQRTAFADGFASVSLQQRVQIFRVGSISASVGSKTIEVKLLIGIRHRLTLKLKVDDSPRGVENGLRWKWKRGVVG